MGHMWINAFVVTAMVMQEMCQDICEPSCNRRAIGDGECDDGCNTAACDYAGGDCYGTDVKTIFCEACQCLDPNPSARCDSICDDFVGDGVCDDLCNTAACDYDGGDCCGSEVDTMWCEACECLDPTMSGK